MTALANSLASIPVVYPDDHLPDPDEVELPRKIAPFPVSAHICHSQNIDIDLGCTPGLQVDLPSPPQVALTQDDAAAGGRDTFLPNSPKLAKVPTGTS